MPDGRVIRARGLVSDGSRAVWTVDWVVRVHGERCAVAVASDAWVSS